MSTEPPLEGLLPAGAATGIGSLPHRDPADAIGLIARTCPALPFWPQLPRRDPEEGMIAQGLRGLAAATGWSAFREALDIGIFTEAVALKGQVTGPWTLSRAAPAEGGPLPLVARLAAQARAQARALRGLPTLLLVDEPSLGALPAAARPAAVEAIRCVFEAIRAEGATPGLHCCASMDPTLLPELGPAVFSFDAGPGLEDLLAHPALRAWVEGGGWLCAGLIPTAGPVPPPDALLARWSACAGPPLGAQGLVAAACGLGLRPVPDAERRMDAAAGLSAAIRNLSGPI